MKDLTAKHFVLGFQHLFAMFGATVLVPTLTGLNPSIALLAAGLGTLVFHLITGGKVPVFLGSSFAFIGGITLLMDGNAQNIPIVQGGVIAAGLVYVLFSVIIYFVGTDRIKKLFPPVVTAPGHHCDWAQLEPVRDCKRVHLLAACDIGAGGDYLRDVF